MKTMRLVWGLLFCLGVVLAVTACDSEKMNNSQLVGTWVEQSDLYSVVLTLTEDNTFDFRTNGYAPQFDGSGRYGYSGLGYGGNFSLESTNYHLILTYSNKVDPVSFLVISISSNKLVIEDKTRYRFNLTKK